MLSDMPLNNKKDNLKRKILFIIIGIICAISIILAVLFQVLQQATPPEVQEQPKQIIDFNTIAFDNNLNEQGYAIKSLEKVDEDKNIIYSKFDINEKVDGKFDLNIKIPIINIDNPDIAIINKEIDDLFVGKARDIITSEEEYETIYTVEYTAYINSNILSLIIKSTVKEGTNAQRVILKTYTYNITTNDVIDMNEMLSIKQLNKVDVQNEIINVVTQKAKEAQSLIDLGYKVYKRDLSDEMYEVDNVETFFYGPEGTLYIIYAYGNNGYTTESDIISFR